MCHLRFMAIAISASLGMSARAGAAQQTESHPLEIGFVVGHVTADGKDFSGTKGATGFSGTVRYIVHGHLGLGVGIHYSDHALESVSPHLHIRVLYAEGRYLAPLRRSRVTVFGGPRGGWAHEDITSSTLRADGWVLGGLAGLDWRFAPQLGAELQLSETAIHLGDLSGGGGVISGSKVSGSSFGIEAGFVVRF